MTKAPTPTEQSKTQRDNTKNATKNFDYTTIADRLRTTIQWEYWMRPILQTDKILDYLLKVYIILYFGADQPSFSYGDDGSNPTVESRRWA